jgi:hypothetical protein
MFCKFVSEKIVDNTMVKGFRTAKKFKCLPYTLPVNAILDVYMWVSCLFHDFPERILKPEPTALKSCIGNLSPAPETPETRHVRFATSTFGSL